MLNILRKQAQSTVIQILVLMIAVVFVFWGVGGGLGNKRNALATVNGIEIPYEDYQRTYDTAIDNLRVQFGGSVPQGFIESLGLKQQIINQLVQGEVLRQGGMEMGINVSKMATQDQIKAMEVFQQNGQFDLNRYKEILSQNRMTPVSFEAGLQNDLLTKRITEAIQKFALLPENVIQSRYDFSNEEVKLAYVALKSTDFADKVVIEDDKLITWFDQQKNQYLSESQIRLKYLFFSYDDDLNQVSVTEEQLKAKYNSDISQYVTPEQRHARHILFRINETDDAQVRIDKKKKAEEVLKMVQEGQDFAELAKQYSEGPTATNGGDLGFFNKGAMVEQFDEVVFQMQPGNSSDIVETVFGFHIIKLEEVRPESTKSFEDVEDSIANAMKSDGVKDITRTRIKQAYEDIIRSGSLDKYSENMSGEVLETDYFAQSSPPGAPISDPKFLQAAFSLKKGELSSLVQTTNGYAILFVDDIKSPSPPEFETVRDKVVADYVKVMSVELAKEKAESVLKESVETKTLTAENLSGVELEQTSFVKRSNPTDAGELPAQIVQQAFDLSLADPFPSQPFTQGETFYVFQLLEKRQGEEPLDETQRQVLSEQLVTSVRNRLLSDWVSLMKSSADVWTNEQILQ